MVGVDEEHIGKRVFRLRKQRGLTQEQLAQRVGVTAMVVSRWERGVSKPSLSNLAPLALALACSTDDLVMVRAA